MEIQNNMPSFNNNHKYIIDTSSILTQKYNEFHDKSIYPSLWQNIENLIKSQIIVTCSEIRDEIKDNDILNWLISNDCVIIPVDESIQKNVKDVVTKYPELINFKKCKSSGDAFLIATAIKYNLIIITQEKKDSQKKIPYISNQFNLQAFDVNQLCKNENWQF
jgi:hypothetical protein